MAPISASGPAGRTAAHSGGATNTAAARTMAAPSSRAIARPATSAPNTLRHTASSSSLRGKPNTVANANAASRSQQSTSTAAPPIATQQVHSPSLYASLPTPTFPPAPYPSTEKVAAAHLQARLLQLALAYTTPTSATGKHRAVSGVSSDLDSACFYARLALNCDPASVPARRLLASTLLHGARPFLFGPSVASATNNVASIARADALAAIEVLQGGSSDVFLDVGCARIFAAANQALGRVAEAEEALGWTLNEAGKRAADTDQQTTSAHEGALPPSLTAEEDVQRAGVLTELGRLSARANRYDEAKSHFHKARDIDAWNWSAWVTACDVGGAEDVSASFRVPKHEPRSLYAAHLERVLRQHGYDKDAVTRAIDEIVGKGDGYFVAAAPQPSPEAVSQATATPGALSSRAQPPTAAAGNGGEQMERVTSNSNKRTVAQAITPSSTTSSLARPGSRVDVATAAKRMRTMPSTTAVKAGPKAGVGGAARTHTAGTARPGAASFLAAKSKLAPPAATMAGSVRMTGTLSASRTNEQARPASSASTSSRSTLNGTDDTVKASPRRSARVGAATLGDEEQQQPQVAATARPHVKPPQQQQRPHIASTVRRAVVTRPAVRAAVPSSSSSSDAESANPAKRVGSEVAAANKALLANIVQTAAQDAVREAALFNALDGEVLELVRTFAAAYQAVRNSRGRLALALLRPRGPLSSREADEVRREAVLARSASLSVDERAPTAHPTQIQVYAGLSTWQRNCVEVQCLLGRALHDVGRYHLAEKHFAHARRLSPSRMAHMDIYSLTLFHLQRDVAIAQLANDLQATDATSGITHIVCGNAFALQGEHGQALHFFQRACLAAPAYAYAFTLAGYEACEMGELETSAQFFREAIKIEKRHWNAFAGLGQVALQENKLADAAHYYGQALGLHRSNAVLWDVYGRVKMVQGKLNDAERAFECSLRLDSTSAMSHVKLAEVLLRRTSAERDVRSAARQAERAHEHLLRAIKIAPDEAHVHLMLAKSYMDKGSGSFATLQHSQRGRAAKEDDDDEEGPQEVSLSDLAHVGMSGPGHAITQQQQQIRATGHATLPARYRAEISHHLCTAVDLNPRLSRYVKAMGEGARAALRGAAARLTGDMDGVMDDASALTASMFVDRTAGLTTGEMEDSMLELDSGQVLEDLPSEEVEGGEGDDDDDDGDTQALSGDEEDDDDDDDDEAQGDDESYIAALAHFHEGEDAQGDDDGDADASMHESVEQPVRMHRSTPRSGRLGLGLDLPQSHAAAATSWMSASAHTAGDATTLSGTTEDERDVSMSF